MDLPIQTPTKSTTSCCVHALPTWVQVTGHETCIGAYFGLWQVLFGGLGVER